MTESSIQMSTDEIALYLEQHPNFFAERDDLLLKLTIPHRLPNQDIIKTVSLVEKQVHILREQNIELRHRFSKLVEVARDNDTLFEKTKRLILALLDSVSLDELAQVLDDKLRNEFNSDVVNLLVFDSAVKKEFDQLNQGNILFVREQNARKVLEKSLSSTAICGVFKPQEIAFLFPESKDKVGSAAIVPLHLSEGSLIGLLALGSFDAKYFHSSMGTLLLNYVGDVLARVLENYFQLKSSSPSNFIQNEHE